MTDTHTTFFAYIALLLWPAAALYLYSTRPVGQATIWTILGGYLLLPPGAQIKFEMVPAFGKESIPNLSALIGCMLCARRMPKFFRGFGLAEVLILSILIVPLITSLLNGDTIRIGQTVLPGVGTYDAGSAMIAEFIFILPFFLARDFLRSADDNADLLRVMAIAGLAYSLPILFEVRMSPQLQFWIYGDSRVFVTELRDGSFRPIVFLQNGLVVAFFATTAAVAAASLWRTQTRIGRLPAGVITTYLSFIVVLCRTLSSLVYGGVLIPLIRWASPRMQLGVACVLVTVALSYPLLREADLFPTKSMLEAATAIDTDRAASLKTRFDNEDQLLKHAWERPWFGWGRFARNRVYHGLNGRDSSITDGYWIITLGTFGLVGFIAQFGLLGLVVFRAAMALKLSQSMREAVYLAALALIVAINVVDLLPNASISPWTWLLVGTLLGRAEELYASTRRPTPTENLLVAPMKVQRADAIQLKPGNTDRKKY